MSTLGFVEMFRIKHNMSFLYSFNLAPIFGLFHLGIGVLNLLLMNPKKLRIVIRLITNKQTKDTKPKDIA